MSDLPQISHVLPGFLFSRKQVDLGQRSKGFKDNVELEVAATYASSGHLDIDTVRRQPRRNDQRPLLDQPAAADRLSAALGRRSRRLLRHGGQGLVAQERRRPLRPLHQSLGPAKGRPLGRAVAAQEADHVLARKDDSVRLSQADPRRHPGMEQGLREGRLRQRHRSPPAARQATTGTPKTSTTTPSAGSPPGPALPWGPRA